MSARAERVKGLVKRHGQQVVVNGTRTMRAVVFVATSGLLRSYLPDGDLQSFVRPVWAGVLSAEEALNEGDAVSYDGTTYTVRRVTTLKIGDAPVVKVAIWSR